MDEPSVRADGVLISPERAHSANHITDCADADARKAIKDTMQTMMGKAENATCLLTPEPDPDITVMKHWNDLFDAQVNVMKDEAVDISDTESDLFVAQNEASTPSPATKKHSRLKKCNAKPTKPSKRKARQQLGHVDLNAVMGVDLFHDIVNTANLPDQPDIEGASTRQEAFRRLRVNATADRAQVNRDLDLLLSAMQACGSRRVAVVDGGISMKGMKTTLYPYQVCGVGFMRSLENADGPSDARGGILADYMGLGKTVMVLSTIVNGRGDTAKERGPTLIVASPNLLDQWYSEITKHVCKIGDGSRHGIKSVVMYKQVRTMERRALDKFLLTQDIVLATYHAVQHNFPAIRPPSDCTTVEQRQTWYDKEFLPRLGALHRCSWKRVVLDEAHAIKNSNSRTSRACLALTARYHWAVTGTPVLNRLEEFYPYLKFIRDPWVTTPLNFATDYCDSGSEQSRLKLQALLRRVMLRRTHASTMFGSRLITLPELLQPQTMTIQLSTFEQKVYDIVQARFIERINECAKTEDTRSNRHIFTMILRLRQVTGHVLLIQETLRDLLTLHDLEALHTLCERMDIAEESDDAARMSIALKKLLAQARARAPKDFKAESIRLKLDDSALADLATVEEDDLDKIGFHGMQTMDPKPLVESFKKSGFKDIKKRTKCSLCRQEPNEPYLTDCLHVYCKACIEMLLNQAARFGRDRAKCKECAGTFATADACVEPPQVEVASSDEEQDRPRKRAKKNKKSMPIDEDWMEQKGAPLPSGKTKAMLAQVQSWFEEDPSMKIIIFSQFLKMIKIMGKICEGEGWSYVKYHGGMTQECRGEAIRSFKRYEGGAQIMLASLKCGGQGLNLTVAARVLIMDSWWNDAIEQQAFMRVYRIGQERETQMTRIMVADTIDETMFDIKDRKSAEINPLMESNEGEDAAKTMSTSQLMELLGEVAHDEQGRPYIINRRRVQKDKDCTRYSDLFGQDG